MPLIQRLLSSISIVYLGIVIILILVLLSITGLLLVRRYISHQRLKLHNDVAGFIFATLGATYAVLLAFTVVIVWQNFDRANEYVDKEANCLTAIYMDSKAFPEPLRSEICMLIDKYANIVVNEEWKKMDRGESSLEASKIVKDLWALYSNYSPETVKEQIFFDKSLDRLNEFVELRRFRLLESRTGLNPLLWFILIAGGIITIIFTFFFGTENLRAHIVMTALLAAIISLSLLTILAFDYPFTGDVRISPDAFKKIISR